jgi:hypothetical protein
VKKLRRIQETFYADAEWPHLFTDVTKELVEGQRYYDFPEGIDTSSIIRVTFKDGESYDYQDIRRGIRDRHYASSDSRLCERDYPPELYDFRALPDGRMQFEVWPLPSSSGGVLIFKALRPLRRLTEDDDRCDLDAMMLYLQCTSELLRKQKSEDADTFAQLALARKDRVLQSMDPTPQKLVMGGKMEPYRPPRPLRGGLVE